jgi:hypothetical protein
VVPVAVDVADADGDGDGEVYREADGEVVFEGLPLALVGGGVVGGGSLVAAEWLADGLADALAEGEGDDECEGDGEDDGDEEGDGDGEDLGVLDGSAWHAVSVLGVAAVFAAGAACAVPSTPRVRKLPVSKVTAATLTCAKRIWIACLRCSSGLPCALRDSEAGRGGVGRCTHFR